MTALVVEPDGSADTGVCECCGNQSRRVWGYVYRDDRCLAAYFVHWTLGQVVDHGANVDIIIGEWGDTAESHQRAGVSLAYRVVEGTPNFMVIDAIDRSFAQSRLVGRAFRRDEVIGTSVAAESFAIIDAFWLQDDRIAELRVG